MTRYVGLDVSQKFTTICIVDGAGRRLWRGQCASDPEQIERAVRRHGGDDVRVGIETGPMTPWLVHGLRGRQLDVTCLDARHAKAALKMQINKTDQNDGTTRRDWRRSCAPDGTAPCTSNRWTRIERVRCWAPAPSSSADNPIVQPHPGRA